MNREEYNKKIKYPNKRYKLHGFFEYGSKEYWLVYRCLAVGFIIFGLIVLLLAVWTESWTFFLKLLITIISTGIFTFFIWFIYKNKKEILSAKEIEKRKKDYKIMLNNHLISQKNYEKMIKLLDNYS